jgi:hypothetical protein
MCFLLHLPNAWACLLLGNKRAEITGWNGSLQRVKIHHEPQSQSGRGL